MLYCHLAKRKEVFRVSNLIHPSVLAVAYSMAMALCVMLGVTQTSAQTLYGSIVGSAVDSSGSVIAGATVTAIQAETNETRTVVTNESGLYQLSTLPAGTYTVTIVKTGFDAFQATNIVLRINATARVDAMLSVGAATQTVTVSADTAQLQTDRIDVHSDVTAEQLQELPQPTRTYEGLLGLLPGVAPPNPQWAGGGGTNNPNRSMIINVNGTSASGTSVSIDGVSALNPWVQFYSTAVPSTDAIETVNTVTASSGADQGIMNGGGVRLQIKSGTNNFHGTAYGYHISNAMKAGPYFTDSGYQKPKYIDNNDGGTFGGPILKNRLFFFGSYEGDFLRQAAGGYYSLPTPLMTQGILASPTPIYDPATGNADGTGRTPFAQDEDGNYIIPQNRFASASSTLLSYVPSGVSEGVYTRNLYINTPYRYNLQKIDTKFDWDATSKLRLSGRYSLYPYKQSQAPAFGDILGPGTGYNTNQNGNTYAISAMATYVANQNLVIDAVFGVTHTTQHLFPPLYNQRYGQEVLKIPGTNLGPLPSAGGVPQFNFSNGLNSFGESYAALTYQDPVFQYSGNVTWVKRNHSLRFGVEMSQQHMNHQEVTQTAFNFSGGATSLNGGESPNEFNSFADFLLGLPTSASSSQLTEDWVTLRTWTFAPYISDTWQVSRKLTLYAGTGWDYLPVPKRDKRGIEFYDPDTNEYKFCGVGDNSSTCGMTVQKYLFAPRVGFAYRVQPNTVLRAGYSLAPEQINMARDGLYNYPATISQSLSGTNSYAPATTLTQGLPELAPPDLTSGVITLPTTIAVATPRKDFVRGYTESYNLTMQQDMGWNLLGQIAYVGTLTVHQHSRENINYGQVGGGQASRALYAKYGITADMQKVLPDEHMNYQSLQAQLQRRFSGGLQFMMSYTYSKWMGLCCDPQGDGHPAIIIPQYNRLNWALMPDDRTHNFQLSAIYEPPFGKGRKYVNTGLPAMLAGGWQTNWVLARYSGTPFSVSAPDTALNAPGNSQRADQVKPKVKINGYHGRESLYFDTEAFGEVNEARFGTAGFDSVRGPGYFNLDFSLFRSFPIKESMKLQFRAEGLNVLNHPNFSNPSSGVTDGNYGKITGTNAGSRLIAERFLRLGIKLSF